MNTADTRHAAMATHWNPTYPLPNSVTLTQGDRQQVVGVYPGVLAGVGVRVFDAPWRRPFNLAYRKRYRYDTGFIIR